MNARLIAAALALLFVLPDASAQQPASSGTPEYKPPVRGAPARRVGGSSRGAEELPFVAVIAPDHVGHTVSEQPALYWFVSRRSPVRVEITLIDSSGIKPVVETSITSAEPGIHRFSLADHDVRLKPGEEYQWSVSLVADDKQRSNDVVSQGSVQLVAPSPQLQARLAGLPLSAQARVYAAEGVWYDAIAAISESIAREPDNRELRTARAALLEQVDLKDAAAFERRQ
jgi:hypothetical protein